MTYRDRVDAWVKAMLRKASYHALASVLVEQEAHTDLLLRAISSQARDQAKNPLNRCGAKYFSQTDEDGITLEITRRLGLERGVFAELGVGNGLENNTLLLLALGWKGFWIGNESLAFKHENREPRFAYVRRWIDRTTLADVFAEGLRRTSSDAVDLLGIDLDGNDIYFVSDLLALGLRPKIWIVEYNAKFPPPIQWSMEYDPRHVWRYDDYFGASLAAFDQLFTRHGYRLVCCNAHSGVNAFFVPEEYSDRFDDVPRDINALFYGACYYEYHGFGHRPSAKTIERMLDLHAGG